EQFDGFSDFSAEGTVQVDGEVRTGIKRNRALILGEAATGSTAASGWNRNTGVISQWETPAGFEAIDFDDGNMVPLKSDLALEFQILKDELVIAVETGTQLYIDFLND